MDADLVALARAVQAVQAMDAAARAAAIEDTDDVEADVSSTYMPRSPGQPGIGLPAAGWYSDPRDPLLRRWWDGAQWTNHVRSVVADPARSQPVAAQLRQVDTRTSIKDLAADIDGGQPMSRFAPGAPQPVQHPQGRHAATGAAAPVSVPESPKPVSTRPSIGWSQVPMQNAPARSSLIFGVIAVLVPVVIPSIAAFVYGGIGLARVAGRGPIAPGRRPAAWGIALGLVGLGVAVALLGILLTSPGLLATIGMTSS